MRHTAGTTLPADILRDQRIIRVIQAIESCHSTQLSLDNLARLANLSPCHFSRHFHATMKESVFHYIQRTRLEKAAVELMLSSHSVLQIAMEVGYSCSEPFCRAFHRQFGASPTHFRKHYKQSNEQSQVNHATLPLRTRVSYIHQASMTLIAMRSHYHDYSEIDTHWEIFVDALQKQGMDCQTITPVGICLDLNEITPPGYRRYNCAAIIPTESLPFKLKPPLFLLAIQPRRCIQLACHGTRNAIQRNATELASMVHAMEINDTLNAHTVMEHYDQPPWSASADQHRLRIRMSIT